MASAALEGVAGLIAFYTSTPAYLPVPEVEGWADIQPELDRLSKQRNFTEMRGMITDSMVARIGIVGLPSSVRSRSLHGLALTLMRCAVTFPATRPQHRGRRTGRRAAPQPGLAMSAVVTVAVDAGVAVLTLNRPERLNAYTADMGRLLSRAYLECDGDDDVRAIVVTGAGRTFCAGADFSGGASPFDAGPVGGQAALSVS